MPTTTGVATEFINFSRASNATVTDSNGRIDWARHNLLLASEQFDTSQWPKNAITVNANSVAAPNGTTTADTMLDTAANTIHWTAQYITSPPPAGLTFTVSAFCKANTLNYVTLGISDISVGNLYATAVFNLSNGTVATTGASGTGYSVVGTPTISAVGNGWYLCSVTAIAGTSVSFLNAIIALNKTGIISPTAGGLESYLGNGSGIYIWGAACYRSDMGMQANTSAYPMYNPTTRPNLLGFTENFDNAAWTKTNILAFGSGSVANSLIAPNGLQTADLIVESTATGEHRVGPSPSPSSVINGVYTVSFYARFAGRVAQIAFGGGEVSGDPRANFDLSNGVLGSVDAAITASITSVGNGWYRCSGRVTVASTTLTPVISTVTSTTAARRESYTGDGTSGIYLWGAQLSDSASLDPYVANHFAAPSAAAYYGPRLDFDASTLAAKGLLVEEQRTNLLLRSAEFDVSATWTPLAAGTGINAVVTANDAVAPDGTTTADKVVFDRGVGNTITDRSYIQQSVTVVASSTYAASFWIKAATAGDIGKQLAYRSVSGGTYALVTLTASWQRLTLTEVAALTSATVEFTSRGTISSSNSVGVHLWGAQLELGSFATSYIPTTSATVTRSADVAQVGTAAFPYSATEGTLVFAGSINGTPGASTVDFLQLSNGASNAFEIALGMFDLSAPFLQVSNSTTQASIDLGAISVGSVFKMAGVYKTDDFAGSLNSGTVLTDNLGSVPSGIITLGIGSRLGGVYMNGHIRQITYIPRRLTNAELQSRSA